MVRSATGLSQLATANTMLTLTTMTMTTTTTTTQMKNFQFEDEPCNDNYIRVNVHSSHTVDVGAGRHAPPLRIQCVLSTSHSISIGRAMTQQQQWKGLSKINECSSELYLFFSFPFHYYVMIAITQMMIQVLVGCCSVCVLCGCVPSLSMIAACIYISMLFPRNEIIKTKVIIVVCRISGRLCVWCLAMARDKNKQRHHTDGEMEWFCVCIHNFKADMVIIVLEHGAYRIIQISMRPKKCLYIHFGLSMINRNDDKSKMLVRNLRGMPMLL